ncbi:MAG: hypothetical protein KDD53_09320, partial [Bdellovibrionales bacterium]|nr:hypothetical protein [Bdellovibrionales bacterium]
NVIVFSILIGVVEFGLFLLYSFPPPADFVIKAAQKFHSSYERLTLHYMPQCTKYDSEVTYTLRPGTCRYPSREFDVEISANHMGLRDDEESLNGPEVIVLGDSQVMGWGVNKEQTVEHLLEEKTGMKVLSAAVPSYATVREMRMLSRLDTSKLRYLIIQYCDNDFAENKEYAENGDKIKIMPERDYNLLRKRHMAEPRDYYFGRYMRLFFPLLSKPFFEKQKIERHRSEQQLRRAARKEVNYFLNPILKSATNLENVEIIVFELNSYNKNDSYFVNSLDKRVTRFKSVEKSTEKLDGVEGEFPLKIKTLDASHLLGDDEYYLYDDHVNAKGYDKLSDALIELMGRPAERMKL